MRGTNSGRSVGWTASAVLGVKSWRHECPVIVMGGGLVLLRRVVYQFLFFFKQKTAYEIGLGIPAEPLFRSIIGSREGSRNRRRLKANQTGKKFRVGIKSNISTNRNNLISGVDRCIHLNAMKKTTITSI